MLTAWITLIVAGLFEIAWALGLKYSQRFTNLSATVFTLVCLGVSFVLLERAARSIPIGTAYAVWTAIGAAGVALYGMAFLGEPRDLPRLGCISLVVAGVVGLKLLTPPATP